MSRIKTKFLENNAVTNEKAAQVPTQTIKGRTTAGTGNQEDLTATQATAILDPVVGDTGSGGAKGLVPAPAVNDGVYSKFLRADGTWSTTPNINYILNSNIEVSAGGYANYADSPGISPVDGTGGSPVTNVARTTSNPLVGSASLEWVKSANDRQGEGFSYDFSIDPAYRSHQLSINYLFEVTSGTFVTGDMTLWVYDVSNNILIQPSAYQVVSTGVAGPAQTAVFQAAANSTSYRLIFHTSTTSALAYSLKFDNISVNPQVVPVGSRAKPHTIQRLLSGSGTYTPPANCCGIIVDMVGSGSAGSGSGAGAGNGAAGNNTTFGSSFLTAGGGGLAVVGGNGGVGGSNTFNPGSTGAQVLLNVTGNGGRGSSGSGTVPSGNTSNYGGFGPWGGQGATNYFAAANAPDANSGCGGNGGGTGVGLIQDGAGGGAGGRLQVFVPRPTGSFAWTVGASVSGGAAGTSGYAGAPSGSGVIIITEMYYGEDVIISDSAATRVVATNVGKSSSQSIAGTGSFIQLTGWDTASVDTHGSMDSSTGVWTCKVPGIYRASIHTQLVGNGTFTVTSAIQKNGVGQFSGSDSKNTGGAGVYWNAPATGIMSLVAGDTVTVHLAQNSGGSLNTTTDPTTVCFSIEMIQGPAQIQAATIVSFSGRNTTGTSVGTSATDIIFETGVDDSSGSYNTITGEWTCPAPGRYKIESTLHPDSASWTAGSFFSAQIWIDGSFARVANLIAPRTATTLLGSITVGHTINLLTGQKVKIRAQQNESGGGRALITVDGYNLISITRIGGVN